MEGAGRAARVGARGKTRGGRGRGADPLPPLLSYSCIIIQMRIVSCFLESRGLLCCSCRRSCRYV